MSKELEIAKSVAYNAGQLIMKYYEKQNFTVKDKGGQENYLTEADMAAEEFISSELKEAFPDYGFIGEESFDNKALDNEYVWIVDPLDGTRDFVKRTGEFGVHIGLAKNGRSVLGVVYFPVTDELFFAERGKGAFLDGNRVHVSDRKDMADLRFTGSSRISFDKELEALYNKTMHKPTFKGSSGLKACLIAKGYFDYAVFTKRSINQWDICAPEVILEEAGGKITDGRGMSIKYTSAESDYPEIVLFSNGKSHRKLLDVLNR